MFSKLTTFLTDFKVCNNVEGNLCIKERSSFSHFVYSKLIFEIGFKNMFNIIL